MGVPVGGSIVALQRQRLHNHFCVCLCVCDNVLLFWERNHRAYLMGYSSRHFKLMLLWIWHNSVLALDLWLDNRVTKEMTCKHNQSSQASQGEHKANRLLYIKKIDVCWGEIFVLVHSVSDIFIFANIWAHPRLIANKDEHLCFVLYMASLLAFQLVLSLNLTGAP